MQEIYDKWSQNDMTVFISFIQLKINKFQISLGKPVLVCLLLKKKENVKHCVYINKH